MLIFRKLKDENVDFQKSNPKKANVSIKAMAFDNESGLIDPIAALEKELETVQHQSIQEITTEKIFDDIPTISGNSVRGKLRRLAMYDFCQRIGFEKLPVFLYHRLFTGGTITESTDFEDLEARQEFIDYCPMMQVIMSSFQQHFLHGLIQRS